ncbi:acyl-CoA dehydrogenase family protein [Saccharopolyspora rosea]|uniref:Acyl-CoA dehydrogenase family protein n=2 Tax=Saccharopolyspora rosea TaxID=524884 RepID=A0ABW3FR21_9PSEU
MNVSTAAGEVASLLQALRSLRPQLAENGARADREHADPGENMALLGDAGAARLLVPAEFGGLWEGWTFGGWGHFVKAMTEISAGDGPTGQNWGTTALVCREIFGARDALPERTRAEIARRVLDEGLRLVASNAEAGVAGRVTARAVRGGVVLSGTKSFNTNSGGGGLANVGCVLEGGPGGRHHVLVELSHPDVELHDDWDNMGQRGTCSQTVTYHDVFVPDGWHYAGVDPAPEFVGAVMLLHAALMQGIGDGALDAMVDYVRTLKRATLPEFATAAEDPLITRRIGEVSSRLAASRALLDATAETVAQLDNAGAEAVSQATVAAIRAKVACVEASLAAASTVHEVSGARSTSNRFRLDRFWRNARTFASHDPTDTKNVYIGRYETSGELPPISTLLRV